MDGGNDMPREMPYQEHRRPSTGSQPTLSQQTSEMEKAWERAMDAAVAKAGQNFHLQVQRALSLQQSQSMEVANKSARLWKALAGLAGAAAITMGTMMGSCMNAYQAARVDAIEPAARAEQNASALETRVETQGKRIEEIDTSVKSLSVGVADLKDAIVTLTATIPRQTPPTDPPPVKPKRGSR